MRRCVKCYAETDEGAQICKECGSKTYFIEGESTIPCMHCGWPTRRAEGVPCLRPSADPLKGHLTNRRTGRKRLSFSFDMMRPLDISRCRESLTWDAVIFLGLSAFFRPA